MDFLAILVDRINEMTAGFVRVLHRLGIALLVALITWGVAKALRRVLNRMLRRAELRHTLINLFETLPGAMVQRASGMETPFPQRTLLFRDNLQLTRAPCEPEPSARGSAIR